MYVYSLIGKGVCYYSEVEWLHAKYSVAQWRLSKM